MRKSDKLTKVPSWFADIKIYLLLHFLVAVEKGKTYMKTELTALTRQRETKFHVMKETGLEFSFTFSIVVLTHASLWGPSSQVCVWVCDPWLQLSAIFTSSCLVSNCRSLPHHIWPPTNSFFCFLSHSHSLRLSYLSLFQPIQTCCQFAADMFLFLTQVFLIVL